MDPVPVPPSLHSAAPSSRRTGAPSLNPLAILSSIGETIYDWDLLTDDIRWGPNAATVLGLDAVDVIATGRAFHELSAPISASSRREAILGDERHAQAGGVPYQLRYALQIESSGRHELLWIDDFGRWFPGENGRPARAHGLLRVAPRGCASPEPTVSPNDVDSLTGCHSRSRLLRALELHLTGAGRKGGCGLLLIAIDDLAHLNRTVGYDAVDELLARIAGALRSQIRGTDCLARYGGNKFALLLGHCDPAQIGPAAARAIEILNGEHIANAENAPGVAVRVGAALGPRHGRTAHGLLLSAETALERTTAAARFHLFDPAEDQKARPGSDMTAEIVSALNERRVRIALQPVVAARSGEPVFYEALLRVLQPCGDLLDPGAILPSADQSDLVRLVDDRILELALAHLRTDPGTLSLNIAPATLRDPQWPARVAAAVRLHPGSAARLIFEISEQAVVADLDGSRSTLAEVASLGVRIAVDHFGAGYASLQALRVIGPHYVKIDGAFVQNLARSPDNRFYVRSLLAIAREVGAPAIAEWVESAENAAILTEWGAAYLQGTHFGRPELPTFAPPLAYAATA